MKKISITILISGGRTVEKVTKSGFDKDTISSSFEYIGILEGLKARELLKLKEWIRVESNEDKDYGI